jgi:hypothetical protein
MSKTVPIDEAERNLHDLLSSMGEEERITIVDEAGVPLGEVSSSSETPEEDKRRELNSWIGEMKKYAHRIDEGWMGDKSALDQLEEDRNRGAAVVETQTPAQWLDARSAD